MDTISKILVVIDPSVSEQKSLSRAVELAQKTNCAVTAFLTIYDFSYDMTTMLSSDERESMRNAVIKDRQLWLEDLVSPHKDMQIEIKVVWHNRPFEAIIEQVQEHGHNLVVKATHQHDTLKSVIFTPTDWHILRKCPCPVLLVKDHDWPKDGNILTAINAGTSEEAHSTLNNKILYDANYVANLIEANIHIVNSYPGTPVNIAIEIPEFDPLEYNQTMKRHHQTSVSELAEKHGVNSNNTHVKEGLPEDVIPQVAKQIDAELVIIGTVGRTGISAALIGNTAEHVIDSLDCDVLALKPEGFKCPI